MTICLCGSGYPLLKSSYSEWFVCGSQCKKSENMVLVTMSSSVQTHSIILKGRKATKRSYEDAAVTDKICIEIQSVRHDFI